MTNAKYIGLARDTGRSVEDLAHIQQSVSDILRTPVGSASCAVTMVHCCLS